MGQIIGHFFKPDQKIIDAARRGLSEKEFIYYHHLNAIKDLTNKRIILEDSLTEAARGGHLHVLRTLVKFIFWDIRLTFEPGLAANEGCHIDCLAFLVDHGFGWDPCNAILDSTSTKVMRFAYQQFQKAKHKQGTAMTLIYRMLSFECDFKRQRVLLMIDWRQQCNTDCIFIRVQRLIDDSLQRPFIAMLIDIDDRNTIAWLLRQSDLLRSMLLCKIRMRNAVRTLELAFLRHRDRKRAKAISIIQNAWLEWHYRPDGHGALNTKMHFIGIL